MSPPSSFRIQGWDPLLIISQIVALQSTHYLILSFIVPPLLRFLADPKSLTIEGGPENVAMIMDWRELLSSGSFNLDPSDSARVYTIAGSWFATCMIDIFFLYYVIRRPASILDFSVTLLLNHVILTTYYAAKFPTSIVFWITVVSALLVQVIIAEQLCIRRELQTRFDVDPTSPETRSSLSHILPWNPTESMKLSSSLNSSQQNQYRQVIFDEDEEQGNTNSIPMTEQQHKVQEHQHQQQQHQQASPGPSSRTNP